MTDVRKAIVSLMSGTPQHLIEMHGDQPLDRFPERSLASRAFQNIIHPGDAAHEVGNFIADNLPRDDPENPTTFSNMLAKGVRSNIDAYNREPAGYAIGNLVGPRVGLGSITPAARDAMPMAGPVMRQGIEWPDQTQKAARSARNWGTPDFAATTDDAAIRYLKPGETAPPARHAEPEIATKDQLDFLQKLIEARRQPLHPANDAVTPLHAPDPSSYPPTPARPMNPLEALQDRTPANSPGPP